MPRTISLHMLGVFFNMYPIGCAMAGGKARGKMVSSRGAAHRQALGASLRQGNDRRN